MLDAIVKAFTGASRGVQAIVVIVVVALGLGVGIPVSQALFPERSASVA
jgi:VanZ family protein